MNRLLGNLLNRAAQLAPRDRSVRPRLQQWRGVQMGANIWMAHVYVDDLH